MSASPLGLVPFINVEEDFRRRELFGQTPRVASHADEGVIEPMPAAVSALPMWHVDLDRIAHPDDPRDLYGMSQRAEMPMQRAG